MTADPAFTGECPLLPTLEAHLEKGEKVRWAARADFRSVLRTKLVLWWIGVPWTAAVIGVYFTGWLPIEPIYPLGMVSFAFLAAPFILVFEGEKTIYAITDRRALIVHDGMRKSVVRHSFRDMDEKLEVLETANGAGHVYFASNMSTKMRDTDHTGKLAFRDVARAKEVAKILDRARGMS